MIKIKATMLVSVQIITEVEVTESPLQDTTIFTRQVFDDKLDVLNDLCGRINARFVIDGVIVEQHQPGCDTQCTRHHDMPQAVMPGLTHPELN